MSNHMTVRSAFAWAVTVSLAATALATPPGDDCYFSCLPAGSFPPALAYGANPFNTTGATNSAPTDTACSSGNAFHIYNDLWFDFVAPCSGVVTINSCGSSFDTILAVYNGCPFHTQTVGPNLFCIYDNNLAIACNDDFPGCGLQSSVSFYATAGTDYLVRVGAYSAGVTGPGTLNVTGPACTHPTAIITAPPALACECLPVTFAGTASSPTGTFAQYTLESRPLGLGPWNTIDTSLVPVTAATLYVWNDITLAEGYYDIRLTVTDIFGQIAQDETITYVDRAYDSLNIRKPVSYNAVTGEGIYGGTVCFDGTVYDGGCSQDYSVEYSSSAVGPFSPVQSGVPTYPGAVINDPLGSLNGDIWNTRTGLTAVADGFWYVRITGRNSCGQIATVTKQILVDNTPPVAVISAPTACSFDDGIVPIRGTVFDTNIAGWTLQYTGGGSSFWTTIASGSTNMAPGSLLANWNTAGLMPCPYTVRLIASDKATVSCVTSNATEYDVSIDLGCRSDFNRDGVHNVTDIFAFLASWFAGCP